MSTPSPLFQFKAGVFAFKLWDKWWARSPLACIPVVNLLQSRVRPLTAAQSYKRSLNETEAAAITSRPRWPGIFLEQATRPPARFLASAQSHVPPPPLNRPHAPGGRAYSCSTHSWAASGVPSAPS